VTGQGQACSEPASYRELIGGLADELAAAQQDSAKEVEGAVARLRLAKIIDGVTRLQIPAEEIPELVQVLTRAEEACGSGDRLIGMKLLILRGDILRRADGVRG
jgi:hypothetical protein